MRLSDAHRRAIRTALQLLTGAGIEAFLEILIFPHVGSPPFRPSPEERTAMVGVFSYLISFGQNWFEDNTTFPGFLKAPSSSGVNPEPRPTSRSVTE
jgi:hypothetical protein